MKNIKVVVAFIAAMFMMVLVGCGGAGNPTGPGITPVPSPTSTPKVIHILPSNFSVSPRGAVGIDPNIAKYNAGPGTIRVEVSWNPGPPTGRADVYLVQTRADFDCALWSDGSACPGFLKMNRDDGSDPKVVTHVFSSSPTLFRVYVYNNGEVPVSGTISMEYVPQ